MSRFCDKNLAIIHGPDLAKIKSTKVLVAGAGGVGAELLKILALSGFEDMTVIDFDIIDLSNLNRHMYLRREHALNKQSKAEVVSKAITDQYPHLKLKAYCSSIFDFGPDFFSEFDIVFCAVDAREAREYLSRMCTIAEKTMVEAGTRAFAGQVKTQMKGISECKFCQAPQQYEEFTSCSVRAIPVHSLHVVQWAKDFFEGMFNQHDDENIGSFLKNRLDGKEDIELESDRLAKATFDRYFKEDILQYKKEERLLGQKPVFPLSYEEARTKTEQPTTDAYVLPDQKIWSIARSAEVFVESFKACLRRKMELGSEMLILDKNDHDMINFICAAFNLRIYNFRDPKNPSSQLKYMSLFDIKEKVGDITPTVASTNSIVAAIQIVEATKKILQKVDLIQSVYVANNKGDKLLPVPYSQPQLKCHVCSYSNIYLKLFIGSEMKLRTFKQLMEKYYGICKPQILIMQKFIYDYYEDDEDMREIYERKLDQPLVEILNKNNVLLVNENKSREGILVQNQEEPFMFYCYIYVDKSLKDEIKPSKESVRDNIVTRQGMYLQQIYAEKKKNSNRLYQKHYYTLEVQINKEQISKEGET